MSNSNSIDLPLEVILQRLAMVTGGETDAAIVQRLGLSKSALNNWRTRGTVPYKTLLVHLVEHGYSLDWFFAPDRQLKVPAGALTPTAQSLLLQEHGVYGGEQGNLAYAAAKVSADKAIEKKAYSEADSADKVLTAMQHIQAVLSRHGVVATRYELKLLLSVYQSLAANTPLCTLTIETMVQTMASASEREG